MSKAEREKKAARKKKLRKITDPILWKEIKEKYNFTDEDVRQAKDLKFRPETILVLPLVPDESWKLPPKQWINTLYKKKQEKTLKKRKSKEKYERKQ